MGWSISENASPKEKIKAEVNDLLKGLNSTGVINYPTYSEIYDEVSKALDRMYELGGQVNTDTSHINQVLTTLTDKERNALSQAISVLWLNDSSDYMNGLWDVIRAIIGSDTLDDDSFDLNTWYKALNQNKEQE